MVMGAKRKEIEIIANVGDAVKVVHLSSESRTVLWLSQGLFLDVEDTILLVQGVVRSDGYLSIKIYLDDTMVYPALGKWAPVWQQGVSIKIAPILARNITESYECDTFEMGKILAHREKMSRKTPLTL